MIWEKKPSFTETSILNLLGTNISMWSLPWIPYNQAAQLPGVTPALRITLCHGLFFLTRLCPSPPPPKKVHRDSFRFSVSILGFLEGLLKKKYLEVLLEEFWPLWAVILLLWMFLYRLPVPISVWPGRIQGHGCFPNDGIAIGSHFKLCTKISCILSIGGVAYPGRSSLQVPIVRWGCKSFCIHPILWKIATWIDFFCLFRRYNVSFLSLSVWFCGYWDLTKRDHESDLTRPHPKWFRTYLITSIWMIQVVYCSWMTYLDV